MPQRLPSLNALRAFEAASRHLSLTKAARELNVTPAAVSHQIKALEADLGCKLLRRSKGGFILTQTAQEALPVLRAGFDQIAEAARRLRSDNIRHILTVSVGPTFASTWLVRRLGSFSTAYPDIDVRLHTTDWPEEEAVKMMIEQGFQERGEAEGKLNRVKMSSVQLTSYFAGYYAIVGILEEYKALKGDDFSYKDFNERLVGAGSPPFFAIREFMLTDD